MGWTEEKPELLLRRINFKGNEEQLAKVQQLLDEEHVSRKALYIILKYFELTPDGLKTLGIQFPDV
mgnify:CR=1 FL=1